MPRTAPVSLAASMRSASAVPLEPVVSSAGSPLADDDREGCLALALGCRRPRRPELVERRVDPSRAVAARRRGELAAAATAGSDVDGAGAAGSIWVGGSVRMPSASPTTTPTPTPRASRTIDGDDSEDAPPVAVVMGSR